MCFGNVIVMVRCKIQLVEIIVVVIKANRNSRKTTQADASVALIRRGNYPNSGRAFAKFGAQTIM